MNPLSKEEFLEKLKTDKEINNKYGRKHITEGKQVLPPCHYGFQVYTRELSFEERRTLVLEGTSYILPTSTNWTEDEIKEGKLQLNKENIPTRAISLMWNQRSVDTFLGLPFNIASYGFLLEMIAQQVGMVPDKLIGSLGDTHIYSNHISFVKELLKRDPKKYHLPKLKLKKAEDIFSYNLSDFEIEEYKSYPNWKDVPLSN